MAAPLLIVRILARREVRPSERLPPLPAYRHKIRGQLACGATPGSPAFDAPRQLFHSG